MPPSGNIISEQAATNSLIDYVKALEESVKAQQKRHDNLRAIVSDQTTQISILYQTIAYLGLVLKIDGTISITSQKVIRDAIHQDIGEHSKTTQILLNLLELWLTHGENTE